MNLETFIFDLVSQGFMLSTNGDKIKIKHTQEIPAEARELITQHRKEFIATLERLQLQWLNRVASELYREADWLINQGLIDGFDLQELWHTNPALVAKEIKQGANWLQAHH